MPRSAPKSPPKPVPKRKSGGSGARAALLLGSVLLAWTFWHSPALVPLRVLVVTLHELGHATATVLTGGHVLRMSVHLDEGGETVSQGGVAFLILSGGYLGSLLSGLGILALARRPGNGRLIVGLLGLVLIAAAVLWFRPLASFGFLYATIAGAVLVGLGAVAPPWLMDGFARFLGVFSVMYALFDIQDDVFRGDWWRGGGGASDAQHLAQLTLIPAPVWGVAWILAGLGALWAARRWIV